MRNDIALFDYDSGLFIRQATRQEYKASIAASLLDGGVGVILVDDVRCYVEGEPSYKEYIVEDTAIQSIADVANAIQYQHPLTTGVGSDRRLDLHEYDLGNGRFLQVAFDPDGCSMPVEWEETIGSLNEWVVG